jgi:hypothetical protein
LQPCGVPNSRRNVVGVMVLIPGLDANEQAVAQRFHQKWGIVFEKIQETPGKKSPDVTFEIQGFKIVAEIKTIEDAIQVQLSSGEIKLVKGEEGFLEYEKRSNDNTWSRVARAIEKACEQLVESEVQLKAVVLLNEDCALVDDLDDFLSNNRSTGKFKEPLPPGARIARQNLKCIPSLFFWVDIKKEELHVRTIGQLPSSIETFFREKLNG